MWQMFKTKKKVHMIILPHAQCHMTVFAPESKQEESMEVEMQKKML